MRMITLLENTLEPGSSLVAKHGLSLYLETEEQRLLFDTGPDESFIQNARELGVDLTKVNIAVISHAHYDHGGGLEEFLKLNCQAQVFLSPYVQGEFLAQRGETEFQSIGLNQTVLKSYRDRINYIGEKTMISPGITLLPVTEHSTFVPQAILLQKKDGILGQDSFQHELIMVVEEKGQRHVFTGCSHNGIINMVLSVEREFPEDKIQTLIGGFHLMNTRTGRMGEAEEIVRDIAEALLEHDIGKIYTGHCTGTEALRVLQGVLGQTISGLSTGKSVTI